MNSNVGTKTVKCARKIIYNLCEIRQSLVMPNSDSGTDLSIRTSHSCQILIIFSHPSDKMSICVAA